MAWKGASSIGNSIANRAIEQAALVTGDNRGPQAGVMLTDTPDPSAEGVLKVEVVQAQGIADMDFGFAGDTDPYVVVEVNGKWQSTDIIEGSLNPVWNQVFEFHIHSPEAEQVNFMLWDDDEGQDTLVATCSVNLNSLVEKEAQSLVLPLVRVGKEADGEQQGTLTVNLTAMNFNGLKVTMDMLNGQTQKLQDSVAGLQATKAALQKQASDLLEVEGRLRGETGRLQEVKKGLNDRCASLSQKVRVIESTVTDLKETKDSLDQEVSQMDGQNEKLKDQLSGLRKVEEAMKAHTSNAGDDFATFVEQMTSLVEKNQEQLDEFTEQNEKLKRGRQKQQVASLAMMANNFQNWDEQAGLSVKEFRQYISFLGPEFEGRIRQRFNSQDDENPFGKLDRNGDGNLNIAEVRSLLESVVREVDADKESRLDS